MDLFSILTIAMLTENDSILNGWSPDPDVPGQSTQTDYVDFEPFPKTKIYDNILYMIFLNISR